MGVARDIAVVVPTGGTMDPMPSLAADGARPGSWRRRPAGRAVGLPRLLEVNRGCGQDADLAGGIAARDPPHGRRDPVGGSGHETRVRRCAGIAARCEEAGGYRAATRGRSRVSTACDPPIPPGGRTPTVRVFLHNEKSSGCGAIRRGSGRRYRARTPCPPCRARQTNHRPEHVARDPVERRTCTNSPALHTSRSAISSSSRAMRAAI